MAAALLPINEQQRLASVHSLGILDTPSSADLSGLARAAALICDTPIALISIIDSDRQWFAANIGLTEAKETPRDHAFCAHAILEEQLLEIPNAQLDDRFSSNPLVLADPKIIFYAGAVLKLSDGTHAGTLCVIDRKARQLSSEQRLALRDLAATAVTVIETRQRSAALEQSNSKYKALCESSPLGIFHTDAQGACFYVNDRWQQIYGLTSQQGAGHGWVKAIHPDDRDSVFADWKQSIASNTDCNVRYRLKQADGNIKHIQARARAIHSEQGVITGYVGTVVDITERVKAEQALLKSQDLLNRTGRVGGVGGWDLFIETGELIWSDQTCRIHGLEPGYKPVLEKAIDFYAPEARPIIQAAVEKAALVGGAWELELPFIQANGNRIWVRAIGHAELKDGKPYLLTGTFQDITAMRKLSDKLVQEHALLQVTLMSIADAVITTDNEGAIEWMNPVAEKLTGWPAGLAKSKSIESVFQILNERNMLPIVGVLKDCLAGPSEREASEAKLLMSRDGHVYGIDMSASPIREPSGNTIGAVLVFRDVTEQRRLASEIHYRANHDALTGLSNRLAFEDRLQSVYKQACSNSSHHALMFVDLDQFKLVNDTCGHSVGDLLLQQVAALLKQSVRASDMLARLGGDEFGVILENCNIEQAQRSAQLICDKLDEFRFLQDGRRFRIGASIGLVPVDQRWSSTAAAMQAADTSCYAAKDSGRNRVHTWFDTDTAMHTRHGQMQCTNRIEQALDEDGFVLFAQRICSLDVEAGGNLTETLQSSTSGLYAEVLVRMLDTDGSLIAPGAFLPAAERFHLASRIDRWVLKHSIAWIRDLADFSTLNTLCINLSGQSLGDSSFHAFAVRQLKDLGSTICQKICLEITETAAITNLADALAFINKVRELGVRIALDDFGSGASSFGYLKSLPVDIIKIDGQFIKDVIDDPLDDAAVRCFVNVAKVIGVKTVAEFVDRADVLARIKDLGVDYAQGYLLHKPERLSDLSPSKASAKKQIPTKIMPTKKASALKAARQLEETTKDSVS